MGLRGSTGGAASFPAAQQLAFSDALRTTLGPYSIMSVAIESFKVHSAATLLILADTENLRTTKQELLLAGCVRAVNKGSEELLTGMRVGCI